MERSSLVTSILYQDTINHFRDTVVVATESTYDCLLAGTLAYLVGNRFVPQADAKKLNDIADNLLDAAEAVIAAKKGKKKVSRAWRSLLANAPRRCCSKLVDKWGDGSAMGKVATAKTVSEAIAALKNYLASETTPYGDIVKDADTYYEYVGYKTANRSRKGKGKVDPVSKAVNSVSDAVKLIADEDKSVKGRTEAQLTDAVVKVARDVDRLAAQIVERLASMPDGLDHLERLERLVRATIDKVLASPPAESETKAPTKAVKTKSKAKAKHETVTETV